MVKETLESTKIVYEISSHRLLLILMEHVTPKDVQQVLRHQTIKTSMNIYTHVTKQGKKNVENLLNDLDL